MVIDSDMELSKLAIVEYVEIVIFEVWFYAIDTTCLSGHGSFGLAFGLCDRAPSKNSSKASQWRADSEGESGDGPAWPKT